MSEVVNHYVPASASPDLPLVQEWVDRNPTVQANLTETIEHGGGRVVLVISIPDPAGGRVDPAKGVGPDAQTA